jgi:hypothetical protein
MAIAALAHSIDGAIVVPRTKPLDSYSPLEHEQRISRFVAAVNAAGSEQQSRELFRLGFSRFASELRMYPPAGQSPSNVYEVISSESRTVASVCLPLAIALTMHWYPLCALQCASLTPFSLARIHRALLLRRVRANNLVIANAGSERAAGAQEPIVATLVREGVHLRGTYGYMSLASVADVVLMKARLQGDGRELLCVADLRSPTVRTGSWQFSGSMRLSDTASVTFEDHLVPHGRYLILPQSDAVQCLSEYQRSWFHLLIGDVYMARVERLYLEHGIEVTSQDRVERNEIAHLRAYCLCLLDDFAAQRDAARLLLATSTLKLRISRLARSASVLMSQIAVHKGDAALRSHAAELEFIQRQPTADHKIIESLHQRCP